MKNYFTLRLILITAIFFTFFSQKVSAQSSTANYTFSSSTSGSLEDMSSGTTNLFAPGLYRDDSASYIANMGFTFVFMGAPYTQFSINSNGQIRLGATVITGGAISPTSSTPLIAPLGGDNSIQATGKAHFKVTGSSPNKILTIEWVDCRIPFANSAGTFSKFQALLYENAGKIEFKYGTMFNNSSSVTRTIFLSSGASATTVGSVTVASTPTYTSNSASATSNAFADNLAVANLNSSTDGSRIVYTFTPSTASLAEPTSLNFTSVTTSAMVLNWTPPVVTTGVLGYNILRSTDGGSTYILQGQVSGVATATYSGTGTTSLQPGSTYLWRVQSFSEGKISSNLDATQATTGAGSTYYWVGATTGDWNTASNWNTDATNVTSNPRTTPSTSDILIIDGDGAVTGGSTTINISASQSIGALKITDNTSATLRSVSTSNKVITITGASGNDLEVLAGSTLLLNDATTANTASIVFSTSSGMTGNIAGTLTLANNASNTISTTGGTGTVVTVASTGIINNGPLSVVTGSVATLAFASGATYNHLYTTSAGTIPTATYHPNSNVVISGYTSTALTAAPAGLTASTFGNVTYNCTGQTNTINMSLSSSTVNILGTLTISSTGSGSLIFATSGTTNTINANAFAMSSGTLNFASSTGVTTLKVAGTFNQSGGTISNTNGTSSNTIEFNGSSAQNVTLGTISNIFTFRVNNNAGINLTGTMPINTGTGLIISSSAADPIAGGTITYTGTTTLTYNGLGNQTMTSNVFPSSSGPTNLVINNTGNAPTNRVNMASIGDRTLTGTLTQTAGVYTIGDNSLTVTSTLSGTASSTNFVATNGTGQLKKITTTTGTITFPLGDVTGTDEASPVSVNLTAFTGTTSTIGAKVTDAQHPDDASVNDFLSRYWSFTETGATSYTYTSTFTYPTGEVTGSNSNMRLFARNASTWTSLGSTPSATTMSNISALTNVTMPLNSTDFTGRTFAGAVTYVWNQAVDAAYNVSTNWTPTRTSPDPGDVLQFTNNGTYNVTAVPTETIGTLEVSGTTNVTLQSAGSVTLTINGGTGDDLKVGAGSSLVIGGSNTIAMAFAASTTSQIDGTLEVQLSRTYTATNGVTTVSSGGIFKNAGTVTSTASNLIFGSGSKYQHNNTTTQGTIPTAAWNAASTLEFVGYTTNTTVPGNISQTFGNINYNCASQTAVVLSFAASTITSAGTFTMTSTGAGSIALSTSASAGNLVCVNYVHNGGTLNLNSSTGSSLIKVSGTITYSAGTITETSTGLLNAIEFNGSSIQSIPSITLTNDIGFRINNTAGVNIGDGSGTLTLNAGAPIIMVSGAINGTITYGATGLLIYNGASAQTATAVEFPNTSGPFSLTINNSTGVTIPFSRSVGGTLTMTIGNILIGANTLTLGTSATVVGTLTYTAGFIVPTSGSFARWYGASGAPTSSGTTSRFPIGTSTSDSRFVHIFPTSATSFSGGGGVFAVSHTSTSGLTTVADFVDNTITINRRSNSSWVVTTPVLPVLSSGSISVSLQATNAVGASTSANLRLVGASASVTGGTSTGSGTSPDFVVTKPTIAAIADLTAGSLYIGGNSTNLFGIISAIATGNWGDASTWNTNAVPTSSDNVTIPNTFNVTMTSGTPPYAANNLTINTGGTITSNANTLDLGGILSISGTMNVGGGTINVTGASTTGITFTSGSLAMSSGSVNVGPTGGGNRTFALGTGTLNISGGTLTVNGNVTMSSSSGSFIISGGAFNIDPCNVDGSVAVSSGTDILSITAALTLTPSGGTITIVDPPFTGSGKSVSYNVTSTSKSLVGTTIQFGDGSSTNPSTATNGFNVDTYVGTGRLLLGNVIVNGGSGTSRFVSGSTASANGFDIGGNLTITATSELRTTAAGCSLLVAGNIANEGILTVNTTLNLSNLSGTSTLLNTNAQTISGSGTFRNATSSPTANFASLLINNSNASGVTISSTSALSGTGTGTVSGTLTMTAGILNVGANTITVGISTASTGTLSYTAGQIIGKLKRWKATGTGSLTFNLGNSTAEQRATINFTTGPTTGGSITGEFVNSNPAGTQPSLVEGAITVDRASGSGYWSFTTGDAFAMGAGAYTGTFIAKSFAGVSDFSKLVAIQRTDGASAWTLNGTHATTTGSNATATLSRTLMTSFGHIGVGGTLADNPLPIELLKFTGIAKPDFNVLTWTTASEINSNYFEVERLNSEKVFENIAHITAAGNSREINQYQFHDATFTKTNAIEYYRLKMVDRDDHFKYSDVIAVKRNADVKASVSLYPNPSAEILNVIISNVEVTKIQVRILDVIGKIIYENNNLMSNEINSIEVANFPSGIYTLQVTGLSENINQKFIKK